MDTRVTAGVLHAFLIPTHPDHMAYARVHPPSYPYILSRMYLGVGSSPTASVPKQAKAFVTAFANHLPNLSGGVAQLELELFTQVVKLTNSAEPELQKALLKSTPFWNGAFRLMKKSAKVIEGETEDDKNMRLSVMARVVGTATDVLHLATLHNPKESESLVRIWANENFFGALEEGIEQLVAVRGVTSERLTLITSRPQLADVL
jgi:hypothetical protein